MLDQATDEVVVADSTPKRRSSRKPTKIQVCLLRFTGENVPVKIEPSATIDQFKRAVEVIF